MQALFGVLRILICSLVLRWIASFKLDISISPFHFCSSRTPVGYRRSCSEVKTELNGRIEVVS